MYQKIFITFSYHDGYTICFDNKIYSIDTTVPLTEEKLNKAKELFYREKRYHSVPCDNIKIIFWNQIYTLSNDKTIYKEI